MKAVITLIIVISSLGLNAQTLEELNMIKAINNIRTNPKSFIPYVEDYLKSIKSIHGEFASKSTGKSINMVGEINNLISFLKQVKPIDSLTLSKVLYPVAKQFATYLDSTKQLGHVGPNGQTLADRTKTLELFVGENCVKNDKINAAIFILLLDVGNKTKGHRTNLFNPKYTHIAIAKVGNTWVQDFSN